MAADIHVKVEGIKPQLGGQVIIFLYEEKGFPKNHSLAKEKIIKKVESESLVVQFVNVPEVFAIKVLHDEDENGEVTKNWTQIIPREGLGFSNGQQLGFGPPSFKQCALQLSSVMSPIEIKIKYP